eukprot:3007262-Rhodomonas_salina.2
MPRHPTRGTCCDVCGGRMRGAGRARVAASDLVDKDLLADGVVAAPDVEVLPAGLLREDVEVRRPLPLLVAPEPARTHPHVPLSSLADAPTRLSAMQTMMRAVER